jgi:EmrB/QacA subfamily drug resistance transporter
MAVSVKASRDVVTPHVLEPAPVAEPAINPWAIVAAVMVGNFLGPLYSSTANVVIPNLVASFGSDIDTMQWVVTGYMLGFSIAMPLAGWLADTFGRKRIYLIGLTLFTVFSVGASLAWSTGSLIAFRILQAVGGGIISPTGMAIITDVIPANKRGKALGLWGMGMMLAPAFGPWISGLLVDNLDDWRPIFLLGVPFGIAGLIFAQRVLPSSEDSSRETAAFDYVGFGTLSGALALFLTPLTQGNRLGWDDPWIGGSFVASAVLFIAFIVNELRCKHPMLDLSLFADRTFSIAVVLRAVLGTGYYFSIFLLPLFTQTVLGWDATQSGFILLPASLAMAILMPISGTLADKIGARVLVASGMALAVYGTFLFARIDTDWSISLITWDNVIRTAALGLLFTPLTTAALTNIPRMRAGGASAILNTVWQVGGSLGIAVGQAYVTARAENRYVEIASTLTPNRAPVSTFMHQMSGFVAAHHLPAGTAAQMLGHIAMVTATVRAYGDTFLLGALIIAVALPLSLFLPHIRRDS